MNAQVSGARITWSLASNLLHVTFQWLMQAQRTCVNLLVRLTQGPAACWLAHALTLPARPSSIRALNIMYGTSYLLRGSLTLKGIHACWVSGSFHCWDLKSMSGDLSQKEICISFNQRISAETKKTTSACLYSMNNATLSLTIRCIIAFSNRSMIKCKCPQWQEQESILMGFIAAWSAASVVKHVCLFLSHIETNIESISISLTW